EEAAEEFEGMFDPDVKDSYAARLNERLSFLFGDDGDSGQFEHLLRKTLEPLLKEIRELKEKVEGRKAAEQVIIACTLKGKPFEELVHSRLSHLAQPFGDDVAAVGNGAGGSRAGDFLVGLNGSGKRLVVEARDRKQMS